MKLSSSRRTRRVLVESLETRRLLTFTLVTPLPDVTGTPNTLGSVALFGHFHDASLTNTTVLMHIDSPGSAAATGDVYLHLTDTVTPLTVANFLNYVNQGRYNDTIIHRNSWLLDGSNNRISPFVVQGGGYVDTLAQNGTLSHITTLGNVTNEFTQAQAAAGGGQVNVRGTVAMAKLGNAPDSATSEWFFNIANNSSNLDGQNSGFTTFATVSGPSLAIVDAISNLTNYTLPNFNEIPSANGSDFVTVSYATAEATYQVSYTNHSLFSAVTIVGSRLYLDYAPGQTGTSDITVTATDFNGVSVADTFNVTVPVLTASVGGNALADNQTTATALGTTTQGSTLTKTIRLTNDASATGTLSFAAPTVPTGFVIQSILAQGGGTLSSLPDLAPGQYVDVVVANAAGSVGALAGTLTFNSNDAVSPAFDVPLTATVNYRQSTVSFNASSLTNNQVTAVNFGNSAAASFTVTIVVKNNGIGAPLVLSAPSLPAGYSVVTPLPSSLAAGGSASLVLSIDTTTTGTKAGNVVINSDDPITPAFSFPVTATVTHGIIGVTLNSTPVTDNQSTPVDYGAIDQNTGTPNSKTFHITNNGNAPLTFTSVIEPAGFFITSPNRNFATSPSSPPNLGTLAIGASIDITITQRADTGGDKTGTLILNTNDPNTPAFHLPLTGFTHFRKIAVSFNSTNLVANASTHLTPTVSLGSSPEGTPFQVTFRVTNIGDTLALNLSDPTLPAGFSVVTPLPATLNPGESGDLVLSFNSPTLGHIADTIVFNSGDPLYALNPSGFRVPFTADVTYRHLAVTDSSNAAVPTSSAVPFGTILQGDTAHVTYHLANTGNLPLTLSNPTLPAGFLIVGSFPTSIAANSSADIVLSLNSLGRGAYAGAFTFNTDDPTTPTFTLNLTGKILAKGIVVSLAGQTIPYGQASTIDFGKVRQGATGQQYTFTILNSGALPLSIQSTQIPAGYTIVQSLPDTLASGASAQFTVSLDTTNPGFFNGSLHIVSSDPDRPSFDIPLTAAVSLPVKLGAGGAPSVTFTDADGTSSTLTLAGPGSVTLDFFGNSLAAVKNAKTKSVTVAGSSVVLDTLTTAGTTAAKSKLTVTSKGGNKSFNLATVTGTPLLAFTAANARLAGTFQLKAGTLSLFSAANSTLTLGAGASILIPTLTNTTLTTPGNLKSLKITSWNGGSLTSSSIDSFTSTGALSNLAFTTKSVGTVKVGAAFTNSVLHSAGKITSFTAKNFINSSITGKAIATLSLGTVKSHNAGTPFGIAASSIANLTAKLDTGKSLKLTAVNNKAKLASELASQKVTLNDFKITIA